MYSCIKNYACLTTKSCKIINKMPIKIYYGLTYFLIVNMNTQLTVNVILYISINTTTKIEEM